MKVIKILISYFCKCTDYLKGKSRSQKDSSCTDLDGREVNVMFLD